MILQRNTGYKQVGVHLKANTGKITHLGLGRSLRFLVAADITAFAAGAEGGEHMERVERALLFACLGFLMTVSLGAFQVLARIHSKRSLLLFDGSHFGLGIRQGLARQHVDEAPASEQDAHRRDSGMQSFSAVG